MLEVKNLVNALPTPTFTHRVSWENNGL